MKVTKEKGLPIVIGAVPVLIVVSLAVFVSFSGTRAAATPPAPQQPPSTTGADSLSPSSSPGGPGSPGGAGGGSSGLCLPLVGCV